MQETHWWKPDDHQPAQYQRCIVEDVNGDLHTVTFDRTIHGFYRHGPQGIEHIAVRRWQPYRQKLKM